VNIFVMTDMEGISGVCRAEQVLPDGGRYQEGQSFLTQEVNACVEGCFAGGARKVVVRDGHHKGLNFLWNDLDARAEYIMGAVARERMPALGDFDGVILLGYHAMAGTPEAILEHTMSSKTWQNFWINGRKCGEIAIEAGIAGDHGVPVVMVSGDDKVCREAHAFLPGVETVAVKKGLGVEGGQFLSKEKAHRLIRAGAARAVQRCRTLKPCRFKRPVTMRLELVSRGLVPVHRQGVKVLDGRTYEVRGQTVEETLRLLF
jgi:D-amino peptidase